VKKLLLALTVMLFWGEAIADNATGFSIERQREIIEDYMLVTGQISSQALAAQRGKDVDEQPIIKCGMPAVADFVLNHDKIDPGLLKSTGVQLQSRPSHLDQTLDSPEGYFQIHYTVSGNDAVYQPTVDDNSNGVPDYVDAIAGFLDSVYTHEVVNLGYPAPPTDGFYPSGGTDAYDVYFENLGTGYYGVTYLDSTQIDGAGSLRGTSFIILNSDYTQIGAYEDAPLLAAAVTCAHEFFHAVQFGIDFTEGELDSDGFTIRRHWMEMSAVWMEEEIFDNVNDYYGYLPYFFESAAASLQQFRPTGDFHPYGAAVYPIYLDERFGADVIRDIWLRCGGSEGYGPDFLEAAGIIIDSVSGGTETFGTSFAEFALWNYFTGPRAGVAPAGIGYSERLFYPAAYSDDSEDGQIVVHRSYPIFITGNANQRNPHHNGTFYTRFEELRTIRRDTTYWDCNTGTFPSCLDSTEVTDTTLGYEIRHIDSVFTVALALDNSFTEDWGITVIYEQEDNGILVDRFSVPTGSIGLDFYNVQEYRSIAMAFTPASTNWEWYDPTASYDYFVAYLIPENGLVDSSLIDLPAAVFAPYPNPAELATMDDQIITFKFQIPTDSSSLPLYGEEWSGAPPYLVVDLFNVAGERICTLDEFSTEGAYNNYREGEYKIEWDVKNSSGSNVASGVYVAYGRLYTDPKKGTLLAEKMAKVAVIR